MPVFGDVFGTRADYTKGLLYASRMQWLEGGASAVGAGHRRKQSARSRERVAQHRRKSFLGGGVRGDAPGLPAVLKRPQQFQSRKQRRRDLLKRKSTKKVRALGFVNPSAAVRAALVAERLRQRMYERDHNARKRGEIPKKDLDDGLVDRAWEKTEAAGISYWVNTITGAYSVQNPTTIGARRAALGGLHPQPEDIVTENTQTHTSDSLDGILAGVDTAAAATSHNSEAGMFDFLDEWSRMDKYGRERRARSRAASRRGLRPGSRQQRPGSRQRRPSGQQQRPSSRQQRPSSRQQRPSSRQQRPSSRQQRSSSRQQRPSSRQQRPSSRQQRPSSRQQRPSSQQQRPSSRQRRPSSQQSASSSRGSSSIGFSAEQSMANELPTILATTSDGEAGGISPAAQIEARKLPTIVAAPVYPSPMKPARRVSSPIERFPNL